jgi:hypothetical protein
MMLAPIMALIIIVEGSSNKTPKALNKDRRIEDSEISEYYAPNQILELTVPQGTIMAVDTRGFHKGKTLTSGKRLLL